MLYIEFAFFFVLYFICLICSQSIMQFVCAKIMQFGSSTKQLFLFLCHYACSKSDIAKIVPSLPSVAI